MVYARDVGDRRLSFCVSGMLWNRSLVMQDVETKTLWSHILGEAMEGELEGKVLETIPCDMVTWRAWKKAHPKSTVLDMSRTHREYSRDFYRRPSRFVLGWRVESDAFSVSFPTLLERNVINWDDPEARDRLVVAFTPESTSARIFSRKLADGRVLSFELKGTERMVDRETKSEWSRMTGVATGGPLKGTTLQQRVGIPSFTRAWKTFHPDSVDIGARGEKTEKPRRRRI